MGNDALLEEHEDLIARVAKSLSFDYKGIEQEDIAQELRMFVWDKGETIRTEGERVNVRELLRLVGAKYCQRERSKHSSVVAHYMYKPADVRKMLENALTDNTRDLTYVPPEAESLRVGPPHQTIMVDPDEYEPPSAVTENTTPESGMDAMAVSSDIRAGMLALSAEDKDIIFRRFVLFEAMPSGSAERKRANRAVDRLTDELNRFGTGKSTWHKQRTNGYLGARHIMSRNTGEWVTEDE
jgi:hypothetical protein